MDTMICACELSYTCEAHVAENDRMTWPEVLGIRPTPADAWDAYEGGYKGRYFEGWDAA